MQISRIFIQLTTRCDNIDRTSATLFRIPLLFMRFVITRDKLSKLKIQRQPVKNKGSTAAASNSLTDDGQAATCPKCCVIKDFLKCSKNNLKSQANLDTYLFVFNIPSKSNSGRGTLAPRSKREVPSSTTTLDPRIKRQAIALDPLLPIVNVLFIFWRAVPMTKSWPALQKIKGKRVYARPGMTTDSSPPNVKDAHNLRFRGVRPGPNENFWPPELRNRPLRNHKIARCDACSSHPTNPFYMKHLRWAVRSWGTSP